MEEMLVLNTHGISQHEIPICDSTVEEIRLHHQILKKSLKMEEIHDQVIEFHWDYRSKVNYWIMRKVSNSVSDYVFNHEIRSSLNRPCVSVLNMGKMFLDKHYYEKPPVCFAADLTGICEYRTRVEKHRENIYNSNREYVIGCKLRDKSQHWALPVDRYTSSSRYDAKTKRTSVSLGIYYTEQELRDRDISAEVLETIDEIDLTSILDGYVFAVSSMHELNRQLIGSVVTEARTKLLEIFRELGDRVKEDGYEGYEYIIRTSDDEVLNCHLDWFVVYDHLRGKHAMPVRHTNINID